MKKALVVLALVVAAAAARAAEPCQAQMDAYNRALDRAAAAQRALQQFDSSPVAPLDQASADRAERQRQQLVDNIEAAREDVRRASDNHENCMRKRKCKKWKGGWACTVAWTYEKCCLDKGDRDGGAKKK